MPQNKVPATLWSLLHFHLQRKRAFFPLVLYYFGTFPTYFFITNLLIVPLTNLIVYAVIPVAVFRLQEVSDLPYSIFRQCFANGYLIRFVDSPYRSFIFSKLFLQHKSKINTSLFGV